MVDELDLNIIDSLRDDPIVPNAHLAQRFDVASATIGTRVQRLKNEGIARVIGATPLRNAGFPVLAWIWIHVESETLLSIDELGERLASLEGTLVVGAELGEEQIRIVYATKRYEMIEEFVEKEIGSIPGVSRVQVAVKSRVHKERADIGVRSPAGDSTEERYRILAATPLVDKLTDIELRLLAEVQIDGRLGKRELSRRLDISESMVRSRLNSLIEQELLAYILVLHPRALGIRRFAVVEIDVDHRNVSRVVEALKAMDEVSFVGTRYGRDYRIEISVYAPSTASLDRFLNASLALLEGVKGYHVTLNARGYKHDPCWLMADAALV